MCGDNFNAIMLELERNQDMSCFNNFIDDSELIVLPLYGRRFTWSRLDCQTMSRLDRYSYHPNLGV